MNTLNVADTIIRIRWEAQGRYYCLNDFHKAAVTAGANKRSKEPGEFFKATRTKALLCLLEQEGGATGNPRSFGEGAYGESPYAPSSQIAPIIIVNDGLDNGTYVCIELAIAYGQFVSAAFDLKVIRTFLAVQHQQHAMPHIQSTKFWDALRPHWRAIAELALVGCKNKEIAETLGRSAGSVGRNLRRMYEVGYLNPVAVFTARLRPATAARWATEKPVAMHWGRRQLAPAAQGVLDFGQAASAAQGGAQ